MARAVLDVPPPPPRDVDHEGATDGGGFPVEVKTPDTFWAIGPVLVPYAPTGRDAHFGRAGWLVADCSAEAMGGIAKLVLPPPFLGVAPLCTRDMPCPPRFAPIAEGMPLKPLRTLPAAKRLGEAKAGVSRRGVTGRPGPPVPPPSGCDGIMGPTPAGSLMPAPTFAPVEKAFATAAVRGVTGLHGAGAETSGARSTRAAGKARKASMEGAWAAATGQA